MKRARLVYTRFHGAILTNCKIFGISAWGLELDKANQNDLIITPEEEPIITVDNLEVAQFIFLLMNNRKVRYVIDTITSKVVLNLGRFTEDRKAVLNAIRDELRKRDYLPILFDFEKPASKDLTETISTLAHMSRFIIADLTEATSVPHELATIVPTLSVPIQPLLLEGSTGEYAMFNDLRKYNWVLSIHRYKTPDDLLESFYDKVVFPSEEKVKELLAEKRQNKIAVD